MKVTPASRPSNGARRAKCASYVWIIGPNEHDLGGTAAEKCWKMTKVFEPHFDPLGGKEIVYNVGLGQCEKRPFGDRQVLGKVGQVSRPKALYAASEGWRCIELINHFAGFVVSQGLLSHNGLLVEIKIIKEFDGIHIRKRWKRAFSSVLACA
jgi:hypothetical protein